MLVGLDAYMKQHEEEVKASAEKKVEMPVARVTACYVCDEELLVSDRVPLCSQCKRRFSL